MAKTPDTKQEAKKLLTLLIVAPLLIFGFKYLMPPLSQAAGNWLAYKVTGVATPEEQAAAVEAAASDVFVPKARNRFPAPTKGVPDDRLATIALHTCEAFKHEYVAGPDLRTQVTRYASRRLNDANPTQAVRVIGLAVETTCPSKGNLVAQFR